MLEQYFALTIKKKSGKSLTAIQGKIGPHINYTRGDNLTAQHSKQENPACVRHLDIKQPKLNALNHHVTGLWVRIQIS